MKYLGEDGLAHLIEKIKESASANITREDINNWNNKSEFSGSYNDLTDTPTIPTKLGELTNDSGYMGCQVFAAPSYTEVFDLETHELGVFYTPSFKQFIYKGTTYSPGAAYKTFYFINNDYTNMTEETVVGYLMGKQGLMSTYLQDYAITVKYNPSTDKMTYSTGTYGSPISFSSFALDTEVDTKIANMQTSLVSFNFINNSSAYDASNEVDIVFENLKNTKGEKLTPSENKEITIGSGVSQVRITIWFNIGNYEASQVPIARVYNNSERVGQFAISCAIANGNSVLSVPNFIVDVSEGDVLKFTFNPNSARAAIRGNSYVIVETVV